MRGVDPAYIIARKARNRESRTMPRTSPLKAQLEQLQAENRELKRRLAEKRESTDLEMEQADLIAKLREQLKRAKSENTGPLEDQIRELSRERDYWKNRAQTQEENPALIQIAGDYADLREHMREMMDSQAQIAEALGTMKRVKPGIARRIRNLFLPAPKDPDFDEVG